MSKKQTIVKSTGQTINKKPLGMRMWNHRGFYLMFIPVFIYVLIIYYWPMLGVRYSFYDYTLKKIEFVGLKHFTSMFADKAFWTAFSLRKCCRQLSIFLTLCHGRLQQPSSHFSFQHLPQVLSMRH